MPPSGPSTPAGPSNLKKVPPSGPKAQQGTIPTGPSSQRGTPVPIPFGEGRNRGGYKHYYNTPGSSRDGHSHSHSPVTQHHRPQYSQTPYGQSNGYESNTNGFTSSPSAHAESSRQALAKVAPRGPASETRDTNTNQRRSTGQTTGSADRVQHARSPVNRTEPTTYGSSMLPSQTDSRTPIKIAFPSLAKSTVPPKPPRLPPPPPSDRPPTPPLDEPAPPPPPAPTTNRPRGTSPPPPPPPDIAAPPAPPTPSPEKKRIPIPLPDPPKRATPILLPAPPKKDPILLPAPPKKAPILLPAPPKKDPILLPEPPKKVSTTISPFSLPSITSEPTKVVPDRPSSPPAPPPPPAAAPVSISLPAQTTTNKVVPPAFHFREIPVRRRSPSPEESGSEASSRPGTPPRPVEPATPPREPTPKEPTSPPYVPPPYVAPASTSRRPGLGNFRITFDPALEDPKKGKEVKRRFDGEGIDHVKDPRLDLSAETLKRGRGPAKQRTEFHEVEYTVSHLTCSC
jgi:hypothetical protein